MKPLWEVKPQLEVQGHSASDSPQTGQKEDLAAGQAGCESGACSQIPSLQAWHLLKPQFLYLYNEVEQVESGHGDL